MYRGMTMSAHDYLYLEPLLVERLHGGISGLAEVKGIPDTAALDEETLPSPSLYVQYLGDDIEVGAAHQGGLRRVQTVTQLWSVLLHIHPAPVTEPGGTERQVAGQLLGQVLDLLTGWTPDGCLAPLARIEHDAAMPRYNNEHLYYPLTFQANFIYPRNSRS